MLTTLLAILVASASAVMDLRSDRIDNLWLLTGAFLALAAHLTAGRAKSLPDYILGAFLPVILLFPLFLIRVLGAGDIKLFSVLGLFMGTHAVLHLILRSFAAGAVLALFLLVTRRIVRQRFRYFIEYIRSCAVSGRVLAYRREALPERSVTAAPELMHFTVPILAGVLLWAAGV